MNRELNIEINEEFQKAFNCAQDSLLCQKNIIIVKYDNIEAESFHKDNNEFLKAVSKKSIIYCLWIGESIKNLEPVYIGQAKHTISRQRLRAHFTKKNTSTGSQLEKIKGCLKKNQIIGLTFLTIEPGYMRTSLEEWLINKNSNKLIWNKKK